MTKTTTNKKEIKLLILVATEQEKRILIHEELEKLPVKIIVTGIGSKNVINAIKEYAYEVPVINVGLAAGTKSIPADKLIPVTSVMPGFNFGNHQSPITLKLLQVKDAFPCVSAPGFITDVNQFFPESCYSHDYLVDMELYTIASYFKITSAFKVVSDNGDFDDYLSSLEDYEVLTEVRKQIYDIICKELSKI